MYCANCGIELPDQANYCFNCGKPTVNLKKPNANKASFPSESLYIDCFPASSGWFGSDKLMYKALVGKKVVDETPAFGTRDGMGMDVLLEMVSRLQSQGWRVMGTDDRGRPKTMQR